MLKIKDEVDLKELEKFGFKESYYVDEFVYAIEYKKGFYEESIIIWNKSRRIQVKAIDLLDTLYDLIQASYVEKVGD